MMPIDPTDPELDYRAKNYQDWDCLKSKQIACATCGTNLSAKLRKPGSVFVHPFMSTLQCKKCSDFYGDGDFSMDEDGDDKYCRMCGNGGELYICGNKPCPYGFCQKCIDRYIGKNSAEVEADDWKCLHCNCKPLWEVRAVCGVIILEKSRKWRRDRKISTRRQVDDSDDQSSCFEDINSDFGSSIRANRDSLRSLRRSKKDHKVLKNHAKVCDNGDDNSLVNSDRKQKLIIDQKNLNTADKRTESRANLNCLIENIGNISSRKRNGLSNKLTSSEGETTDSDETAVILKSHSELKSNNAFLKLESKSVQRQVNPNPSDSIRQQRKTARLSQRHPGTSKSRESSQKLSNNSDSESSHESANDFVKNQKKKKLKRLKENSNLKDLKAMQTQKSNTHESSKPKTDQKHLNRKCGRSLNERRTRESSLESKSRNSVDDNHLIKKSSKTKTRKEIASKGKHDSFKNDDKMNGSKERAILIKESAHHVTMKNKWYSDSESAENVEDEDLGISTKGPSSTHQRSLNHHKTDKYSTKQSNEVLTRKPIVKRRDDTSDSNEEIESPSNISSPIKKSVLWASKKRKRYTGSVNENDNAVKRSTLTSGTKSKQVIESKRLSSKPICPASQSSSSLDYDGALLDRKKALIKRSYAKFASTEDCVTEGQASMIKDHVSNLLSNIETFGKSLCSGAKGIATKHLTNNVTSVPAVSKTVLKCALLMIRAKESMHIIEREFIKSYENWCESFEVKSIFSDVENVGSDTATSDKVESINREMRDNLGNEDKITEDRAIKRSSDHAAQCSDASNHDDDNSNVNHQFTPETTHTTDKTLSDTNEKSIDTHKDSDHSKSLEKIDKSKQDFMNEDSDEIQDSDESQTVRSSKEIDKNRRDSVDRNSDEVRDSDKGQDSDTNLQNIHKNGEDSLSRKSDRDSINSKHDVMSDCDSREIFSDDECKEQPKKTDKSVAKRICLQSSFLNLSTSQSIASDSGKSEKDDASSKVLEEPREKSVESGDVIESSKNGQDSGKKIIEDTPEKSIKEASKNESCIEDTDELDVSLENLFHNPTASDSDAVSNPEVKSKDSSNSKPIANCSQTTELLSLTEESAPCDTEVGSNSPDGIQMTAENEPLDLWDKSVTNARKSSNESTNDSKLNNSVYDSSPMVNEDIEDLSDCDTAAIFTQLPSDDSTTSSTTNHISKNKVIVTDATGTEDPDMSDLKITSNVELPSKNDDNSNHEVVSPSTETHNPSETIAEQSESVNDPDTNKNSKARSGGLETCRGNEESKIIGETHSTALPSDDTTYDSVESIAAVDEEEMDNFDNKQLNEDDNDSEEAIKRKILESDSESSVDSTTVEADNFVLKVNSDSEEYAQEAIAAVSTIAMDTSKILSVTKQTPHLETDTKEEVKKLLNSPQPVDTEISELNKLAKHRLLSSSTNSSSSETDDISSTLPGSDGITASSMIKSGSITSRTKKKKFDLENNHYYKIDEKLQMICEVTVRRLNKNVLDQFRKLLHKSRQRQEWGEFKSLVDLNNLKKRKRGTKESNQSESSSESSSSKGHVKKKRSKQEQEKQETLLDHLEKMKNGEDFIIPAGDGSDDNNDVLSKNLPEDKMEEELLSRANEFAKDLLIQSSDSENEAQAPTDTVGETEQHEDSKSKTEKEKQKRKDISNEKAADLEGNHENESNTENDIEEINNDEKNADSEENEDSDSDRTRERKKMKEGLAKRNWRLTDSDSSSEEKKWNKSQKKKLDGKSEVEEKNDEGKKEERSKQKKKIKRRVLGSDSDSVILPDFSDSSNKMDNEKKNSSSRSEDSSEMFKNLRKKRRRKRNTGQKTDSDSQSEDEEKPAKQKRKRIKKMASDSDSGGSTLNNSQDTPGKFHRKNIRKVLKDKQVADVTKIAGKEEEERLKRIADRQRLYNDMYELKLAREAKVDKLILDFDEETKKELVSVHEDLVNRLKPHQAQGIKFMWDACFESLERTKSTTGSGCIVAHCMGLGKTFQIVTLAHTLLTHPETGIKTIMVICPLSTVLNWVNEFKKWLGDINNDEDVEVYEMTKMKKNFERKYQLEKWQRVGGVMVLGYEMFRLLSNQTGKKMRKSLHESILKCLVDPGPDLIVCDEGHLLKNEDTALSKAMRRVKTLRRIVLTGTPLQNNLVEYHCMVQFVKPNLLGTKKEFLNRFVNPITNGQFDDSTEYDVKLMKKRAHVLHKMLEGSVQRFDYSVLTPFLPPKQEYVITVRLADIQIKLYQFYLDNFSRKKVGAGTSLFTDFQALQRIWTHPIVLRMNAEKMEKLNEKRRMDDSDSEGSLKDFLDDGSDERTTTTDEDSDVQSAHASSDEKTAKSRRGTRANPIDLDALQVEEEEQPQSGEWWSQFIEPEHFEDMKISSKLVLLFAILRECEQIGDKVLVFSQSLYALSLIEEFLNKIDDETQRGTSSDLIDGHTGSWSLGLDYFRLDGQTAPENRSHYCRIFNNPKNSRARLFLISTRAGGLGINLTAANRVIIFDASWNPSHDVQSIFRIYRFGQKKPCYVYRFLAQGTMEEKIYNRQVTKLSLSCRVVDEQQIERHYSNHDLAELYQFEPNTSKEKPTLNLPKDRLLAEIFRKYEDRIETFHEHDSLLENKAEEELDEEERKEAWKEYEDERTGRKMHLNNLPNQNFGIQPYDMLHMNQADIVNRATLSGINIDNLQALIRKDYPNTTPDQQTMMTQRAIMDMYTYMENEAIRLQQMAAASFTYPTVSNIGTGSFVDQTGMAPAQRQYALQQQQRHQMLMQREQQANYAKRFGNVRGPALSVAPTRAPQIVNVQLDDNEILEVPATPPPTAGPSPSSSIQAPSIQAPSIPAPSIPAPAAGENSKRQEE